MGHCQSTNKASVRSTEESHGASLCCRSLPCARRLQRVSQHQQLPQRLPSRLPCTLLQPGMLHLSRYQRWAQQMLTSIAMCSALFVKGKYPPAKAAGLAIAMYATSFCLQRPHHAPPASVEPQTMPFGLITSMGFADTLVVLPHLMVLCPTSSCLRACQDKCHTL